MFDYYRIIEKARQRVEMLVKRLASRFWGRKAKLEAALELSKAENLLEALCYHLLLKKVYHQYVQTLPADILKRLVETVLAKGSIFWFLQGILASDEVVHHPGWMDDPDSVKAFWGSLCEFVTPKELRSKKFLDWVSTNIGNTQEALNDFFCHPAKAKINECPSPVDFWGVRMRMIARGFNPLESLNGYSYQRFYAGLWVMLAFQKIARTPLKNAA